MRSSDTGAAATNMSAVSPPYTARSTPSTSSVDTHASAASNAPQAPIKQSDSNLPIKTSRPKSRWRLFKGSRKPTDDAAGDPPFASHGGDGQTGMHHSSARKQRMKKPVSDPGGLSEPKPYRSWWGSKKHKAVAENKGADGRDDGSPREPPSDSDAEYDGRQPRSAHNWWESQNRDGNSNCHSSERLNVQQPSTARSASPSHMQERATASADAGSCDASAAEAVGDLPNLPSRSRSQCVILSDDHGQDAGAHEGSKGGKELQKRVLNTQLSLPSLFGARGKDKAKATSQQQPSSQGKEATFEGHVEFIAEDNSQAVAHSMHTSKPDPKIKGHRRHSSMSALFKWKKEDQTAHEIHAMLRSAADAPTDGSKGASRKQADAHHTRASTLSCFGMSKVVTDEDMEEPDPDLEGLVSGPVGLRNLGNTCFINSAIQCVRCTPYFLEAIVPQLLINPSLVRGPPPEMARPSAEPVPSLSVNSMPTVFMEAGASPPDLEHSQPSASGSSRDKQRSNELSGLSNRISEGGESVVYHSSRLPSEALDTCGDGAVSHRLDLACSVDTSMPACSASGEASTTIAGNSNSPLPDAPAEGIQRSASVLGSAALPLSRAPSVDARTGDACKPAAASTPGRCAQPGKSASHGATASAANSAHSGAGAACTDPTNGGDDSERAGAQPAGRHSDCVLSRCPSYESQRCVGVDNGASSSGAAEDAGTNGESAGEGGKEATASDAGLENSEEQGKRADHEDGDAVATAPVVVDKAQVAESLLHVMAQLVTGKQGTTVVPMNLYSDLKHNSVGADFCDGGQHDSQELLRGVLDLVHDAHNRVRQKPPYKEEVDDPAESPRSKADRMWRDHLARDSSPITDLFLGQLQSHVICQKCQSNYHTFEPFMDLSLSLSKEGKSMSNLWKGKLLDSVETCLKAFTGEERLEGNEAFYCNHCKQRCPATKSLRVQRFPRCLLLHIKRFKFHNRQHVKLVNNVSFPLNDLQLGQFASDTCATPQTKLRYDLYAVCNHTGTLTSGHYTAYCKLQHEDGTQRWHLFDDETVSEVSPDKINSANAYMMFYVLRPDSPAADEPSSKQELTAPG